jgi:hypothetical protein
MGGESPGAECKANHIFLRESSRHSSHPAVLERKVKPDPLRGVRSLLALDCRWRARLALAGVRTSLTSLKPDPCLD